MQLPPEILWGIAAFIAAKAIEWVIGLARKQTQIQDETVKELERGLKDNTEALREVRYELKSLSERISGLPKLERDVNEAHVKLRTMMRAEGEI